MANFALNTVSVIDLTNNTPSTIPVVSGPSGVAVDAADNTVFVTNSGSNTVSVISLTTSRVVATIVVP